MKPFIFALALIVSYAPAQQANSNQQPATTRKTLEISGQSVPDAVIQVNGRAYADVLAISQLTGTAVAVRPDRVVLTMPGATPATPPQQQPDPNRLSREFARNAIAHLADIREWRNALETVISIGAPEGLQLETFLQQRRGRAEESLRLAAVSASIPGDKRALQLLQNGFSNIQQWDSSAAEARRNLDGSKAVDPNALSNDPLLAKINVCDRSLNEMLSSGAFYDNATCR
ncbi:MAG: hypothetical protein JWO13_3481 [Acidobacteriales bacterium]|nr:hypothetical protein [Terriglobales bacterium]